MSTHNTPTHPTYEELVWRVEMLAKENARLKNIQTSAKFSTPLTEMQRSVILDQTDHFGGDINKLQVRLPVSVHNKMCIFSDLWGMSLNDMFLLSLNATMVGFATADDTQRQFKIQELSSVYNNYVVPLKKTKSTSKYSD